MATISLSQARALCTASEFQLAKGSVPPAITTFTRNELRKRIDRSRKLRDKWDDTATRQRRAAQQKQGARGTSEAKRSAEKATLFAQVLARFEEQLTRLERSGPAPPTKPVAKKPAKPKRIAGHRQTRSQVREDLSTLKAELNPPPGAARKKTTTKAATPTIVKAKTKVPAKKKSATKSRTATALSLTQKPAHAKGKKRTAKLLPPDATGLVEFNRKQQRSARAAAKQARLDKSGKSTRVQGHVAARGRRKQGKRDSRG